MKKLTIGLLALVAVLNLQSVKAQTADEIVDKHIAAMGGKEKLLSIKSVKKTGSLNTEGIDVGVTVTILNGVGSRNDISVPNMGEGYQITGISKGWEFMPFMGQSSPVEASPEKVKLLKHLFDVQGLLVNYKEKGNSVELLGKEKVDTIDCYKLKITTKDGVVVTEYIDGNTWYNMKSTYKNIISGAEEIEESTFGDFKKTTEGYIFPYSQTIARGTINYSSIDVNIPVDEKIFTN